MDVGTVIGIGTLACGFAMALIALSARRSDSSDRAFEDMKDMYDRVRVERDEYRAKYDRGEITRAQLEDKLEMCNAKQAQLRKMLEEYGQAGEEFA